MLTLKREKTKETVYTLIPFGCVRFQGCPKSPTGWEWTTDCQIACDYFRGIEYAEGNHADDFGKVKCAYPVGNTQGE